MSHIWTDDREQPRLERRPAGRPLEKALAASLLLLLLWSGRDRLPHLATTGTPAGCTAQSSETQAIPVACGHGIPRRNS